MSTPSFTRREWMKLTAGAVATASIGRHAMADDAPTGRPNILFLMSDQHRGDCLGMEDQSGAITPHLDRLAHEGAWFPHAYSSVPSCTPARAGILTGLDPWRHGLLGYSRIPDEYPHAMPQMLADAGYHTCVIGKCHFTPQRNPHGFHQMLLDESARVENSQFRSDYRAWFASVAPNADPDATGIGFNDYKAAPYALPESLHPTRWTGDVAKRFIETYDKDAPFFLKVSFARPHSPYDAPQRFFDMYRDEPIQERRLGEWCDGYAPRSWPEDNIWHGDMGAEETRYSRIGYYGNVTFIDEEIGRIVEALEQRGMLENTLIVYVSDHGDMLGDHHLWRKTYAYEGSARIPFIVRWPESMMNAERGQTRSEVLELRDLLPMFLDAAGVTNVPSMDGRSILPLLDGRDATWRNYIDLEHDLCYDVSNHWSGLTDGHMKYIFHAHDGDEMLFDLDNDPGETTNLATRPAYRERLHEWRSRLVDHLEERGEEWVKDGKLQLRPDSILHSPHYRPPSV